MKVWILTRLPWLIAGAFWLGAVGTGFVIAWKYSATAGSGTNAPAIWPPLSHLPRATDRYTLVMFVHAHCPCSRASLAELGKLNARLRGRMQTDIVFVPEDERPDFVEATLRERAHSLTDALVLDDPGGEAKRFGAETSGSVIVYDPGGRLVFSGGLTAIRSHEGGSAGQDRIVALVTTGNADRADSPVFGCSLESKQEEQ